MQPPFPISQLAILSKIPRYRETVEKLLDKASEQNLEEAWEEMPFIRKADLRERFPESFGFTRQELTEMAAQQKIELERTSGTTEESVELILPEGWWARQEARALSLNERILSTFEPDPFYDNAPMPHAGQYRFAGSHVSLLGPFLRGAHAGPYPLRQSLQASLSLDR